MLSSSRPNILIVKVWLRGSVFVVPLYALFYYSDCFRLLREEELGRRVSICGCLKIQSLTYFIGRQVLAVKFCKYYPFKTPAKLN